MNRYSLNSRTLGSGISVPERYWGGTINVVVTTALDNFTVYTGVLFESAVFIEVTSTTGFIKTASIAASMIAQAVIVAPVTRIAHLVSSVPVTVDTTSSFIAGVLRLFGSSVTTGVNVVASATANRFLHISQNVVETTAAAFGKIVSWVASQNVIESNTANFTSFGEYASSDRYIIVPQEDRDAGVN